MEASLFFWAWVFSVIKGFGYLSKETIADGAGSVAIFLVLVALLSPLMILLGTWAIQTSWAFAIVPNFAVVPLTWLQSLAIEFMLVVFMPIIRND